MRCHSLTLTLALAGVLGLLCGSLAPALAQSTPSAAAAESPDTPVGAALVWVISVLNDGGVSLTPKEITARFAPAFLEDVPPEIIVGLTQ